MLTYLDAIKRPLRSPGKVLILAILFILPIINFIIFGYLMAIARTAYSHKYDMPGFKGNFIKGVLFVIISFIFSIPFFVLILLGAFVLSYTFSFIVIFLYLITLALITVLTSYILPLGITRYAVEGSFLQAFAGLKKAFTREYFFGFLAATVYSLVVYAVLLALYFLLMVFPIPFEVSALIFTYLSAIAFVLTKVTLFTILGEVYRNIQ